MKVALRDKAVADLEAIHAYIAKDSPQNAGKVLLRILETITDFIAIFPGVGHAGRVKGMRELPVSGLPYIIVYRVDAVRGVVHVESVVHGARDR
jgi:addiction module RelE/StbE family toxin